jgi:hypothetical protein
MAVIMRKILIIIVLGCFATLLLVDEIEAHQGKHLHPCFGLIFDVDFSLDTAGTFIETRYIMLLKKA